MGFTRKFYEMYLVVDSVVSVKFLSAVCVGIVSLILGKSFQTSKQLSAGVGKDFWFFVQGIGKVPFLMLTKSEVEFC